PESLSQRIQLLRVALGDGAIDKPEARHRGLLTTRHERPGSCCSANEGNKFTPSHVVPETADGHRSGLNSRGERPTCPLWVKSGHVQRKTSCPLYPRNRHQKRTSGMSALGQ